MLCPGLLTVLLSVAVLAQGHNKHGWLTRESAILKYSALHTSLLVLARRVRKRFCSSCEGFAPTAIPLARGRRAPARFRSGPRLAVGSCPFGPGPVWAHSSLAWGSAPCQARIRCQAPLGGPLASAQLLGSLSEQRGLSPGCLLAPLGSPHDQTSA